jgi:RimJ/RimL family protein N-acetyltransferase
MEIATRRFLLRDFTEDDAVAFAAYHADPRYRALYGVADAAPADIAALPHTFRAWVLEQPRLNYQLAIVVRDNGTIGCCGLRGKSFPAGIAEFGIELAPEYWGRHGYAAEVARALLDFGFDELGLTEIRGETGNPRAARLAAFFGGVEAGADPLPQVERVGVAGSRAQIQWIIAREAYARSVGKTRSRP